MNRAIKLANGRPRGGPGGRAGYRPGFTIIEVLVAVVVVALGFMAAASMVISSTRSTGFSKSRTAALYLAESKLEQLAREKYADVTGEPNDSQVPDEHKRFYSRAWVVEANKPANHMKTVTVTVTPRDSRVKPINLSTILVDIDSF